MRDGPIIRRITGALAGSALIAGSGGHLCADTYPRWAAIDARHYAIRLTLLTTDSNSENWFHNARHWLPMVDHPADKATGVLIVATKADYQVVSNGVIVEQI